jgi:hypothetical protein
MVNAYPLLCYSFLPDLPYSPHAAHGVGSTAEITRITMPAAKCFPLTAGLVLRTVLNPMLFCSPSATRNSVFGKSHCSRKLAGPSCADTQVAIAFRVWLVRHTLAVAKAPISGSSVVTMCRLMPWNFTGKQSRPWSRNHTVTVMAQRVTGPRNFRIFVKIAAVPRAFPVRIPCQLTCRIA